jgi:hypothetical protein
MHAVDARGPAYLSAALFHNVWSRNQAAAAWIVHFDTYTGF